MITLFGYLHLPALRVIKINKNSVFVQFCKYLEHDYA